MTNSGIATIPARSPAAERMQRHRERKKNGLCCVMIELRNEEIGLLIEKQLLKPEFRDNREEIAEAIYRWFEQTLT